MPKGKYCQSLPASDRDLQNSHNRNPEPKKVVKYSTQKNPPSPSLGLSHSGNEAASSVSAGSAFGLDK